MQGYVVSSMTYLRHAGVNFKLATVSFLERIQRALSLTCI